MQGTITEIKKWIQEKERLTPQELAELQNDSRVGVQKLAAQYIKKQKRKKKEEERMEKMWYYETKYRQQGLELLAGVDEAGRGPLAGPVVAAAVILPDDFPVEGLKDSKQMTPQNRKRLKERIESEAIAVGVGMADELYIDQHNILQATYYAMRKAVGQLPLKPEMVLADAVTIPDLGIPQQSIIKGDAKSHSIAAASVIAKMIRDEWMMQMAEKYPVYGFDQNMGYGTTEHLKALEEYGPSPIHRKSFAPVRSRLKDSAELLFQGEYQ